MPQVVIILCVPVSIALLAILFVLVLSVSQGKVVVADTPIVVQAAPGGERAR